MQKSKRVTPSNGPLRAGGEGPPRIKAAPAPRRINGIIALLLVAVATGLFIAQAADARALRQARAMVAADVQKTQVLFDRHLALTRQIRDAIIMDGDLLPHYAPNHYEAVTRLMKKLHLFIANQGFFEELLLYSADNEYLFSSKSSYRFSTFLDINPIPEYPTEEAFRTYLSSLTAPVMMSISRDRALYHLYILPYVRDSVRCCLLFLLPDTTLRGALSPLAGPGHALLLSPENAFLFVSPASGPLDEAALSGIRGIVQGSGTPYAPEDGLLRLGRAEAYLSWRRSESTDYTYIAVQTDDAPALRHTRQRLLLGAAWAFAALSGAAAGLYLYRSFLRPFLRIRGRATGSSRISGLEDITRYLDALEAKYSQATGYIVFNVIRGAVSEEDARQLIENMGLYGGKSRYLVAVISFYDELSVADVYQLAGSFLPQSYRCLVHRLERENTFAMVLNAPPATAEAEALESLALLPQADGRIRGIYAGSSRQDMLDIPLSLVEAATAADESAWQAEASPCGGPKSAQAPGQPQSARLHAFSESELPDLPRVAAPCDAAVRALGDGDFDAAADALALLLDEAQSQALPPHTLRYLCCRVFLAIPRGEARTSLTGDLDVYLLLHFTSDGQLTALLESIRDACRAKRPQASSPPLPLVAQMIQYMTERYKEPGFSFQLMAEAYQMSLPALSRYFHEHAGMTINDYMTDIKITRAKTLLAQSSLSVQDIALEVGYYNPTSFSRRFKQIEGVSPIEYRRREMGS